jgi:hypothetical protein
MKNHPKNSTFECILCTLGLLYTLFREYMYNECLPYVVGELNS